MMNMQKQKRVAAIQDICCAGKCSLTIALPVLSSAGISCSILPTAVMSTHTGGFSDVYGRDLTEDILPIIHHWKKEGLSFDALYSGYLCSPEQIETVITAVELLGTNTSSPLLMVDPAMGDGGSLYRLCTPDMVVKMAKLCAAADIVVPNVTEAAFLLGMDFRPPPHSETYIGSLLAGLAGLCKGDIVLTGVSFTEAELGCACLERDRMAIHYLMEKRETGSYHGTGDLFASALLGGVIQGQSLISAIRLAMQFVCASIRRTRLDVEKERDGLSFEPYLPYYAKAICDGKNPGAVASKEAQTFFPNGLF